MLPSMNGTNGRALRLAFARVNCFASAPATGVVSRTLTTSEVKMSSDNKKQLTLDSLNPHISKIHYAVRGPVLLRAMEIEKELEKGAKKPFKSVTRANLGDAHAMGQSPITFIRQVLACVVYPCLMETVDFPCDVQEKAKSILKACGGGSVGAYSASQGIELIRRHCAEFIEKRDGYPAKWFDIALTNGASDGIRALLKTLVRDIGSKPPGVMIPIPQYPLYSASLSEMGLKGVHYYLNECNFWGLDHEDLERIYCEASKDTNVRAIVVINPGNPTGQVLTRENIEQILKFATKHNLLIFADEVYQDNIHAKESRFHSFRKVAIEMGSPYSEHEMASFMSISKGYMGECGLRGGYMELRNMDPKVQAELYKMMSVTLCPSVVGQAALDCVVKPPQQGDASYESWRKERTKIQESLRQRAFMIEKAINSMKGYSVNPVQGAMYAFPALELPPKAIEQAKKENKTPDEFYAFQLLDTTGICIVPGSGFGQQPGTHHFRTTILPQPDQLKIMLEKIAKFHEDFISKYS